MAITRFMRGPFGPAIPCFAQPQFYVYLLHFSEPYRWCRHYLGSTCDLDHRLEMHRNGTGARLMEVISAAGIGFEVSRLWKFDSIEEARAWEHILKKRQHNGRECPICQGKPLDGYVSLMRGNWSYHLWPQGKRRPM